MTTPKILILCWSFIWGICLISLVLIEFQGTTSIVMLTGQPYQIAKFVLYWAPAYAFTVWAIGCLIIGLFALIFRRWLK